MATIDQNHIDWLLGEDPRLMEQGISQLRQWRRSSNDGEAVAAAIMILSRLNDCESIPASERSRRTHLILGASALRSDRTPLAQAARAWRPDVKNVVARSLSPPLRRLVYGGPTPPATPHAATTIQSNSSPRVSSTAPAPDASEPLRQTVLLLGSHQDHESNEALLRRHKLDGVRVDRSDQFEGLLDDSVCATVIARSWWAMLPPDDHRAFVERLLQHSSFTWIKMDEYGLRCTPPVTFRELHRAIRFTDSLQLAAGEGCRISELDLENFLAAARLLSTSLRADLVPGEVRPDETDVLLAAVAQCVQERHFSPVTHLERVPVGLIIGGRTNAKLFRVEPDDGGVPLIAKMDAIALLRGEMERFCRFIKPWDNGLQPCLRFHAGKGVIVFTLVNTPGDPQYPAPTLEQRLNAAMSAELWGQNAATPLENDLAMAISRSVEKLSTLNARPCDDPGVDSFQWLRLDGLETALRDGMVWEIRDSSGGDVSPCATWRLI